MSVKASVSISPQQEAFARELVRQGRYASLSAVVQRGIDMLREETETREAERAALRRLFDERARGEFMSIDDLSASTEALIARKRREHGL